MVAKKTETAEQKLLKMIEASSGGGETVSQSQKEFQSQERILSIVKIANKILIVCVLGALLFLGNEIKVGVEVLGKKIQISGAKVSGLSSFDSAGLVPVIQRISYYLSNINQRNIFSPYEDIQTVSVVEVSESNRAIVGRTKNLRLVGISWFDTVESASVMVEDVKKKETLFLRKGEKIGDITVKTIYANSVELGYKDEEIILRYDKPKN